MPVVVGQTIPWPLEELDLDNPNRWVELFPLIRPSVEAVTSEHGYTVFVDHALADSKIVQVAAMGRYGRFSTRFLSDKHVAAFVVSGTSTAGGVSVKDLVGILRGHGLQTSQGLVVVTAGERRSLRPVEDGVIELETEGELEFDHVLSLLNHVSETARTSIHSTSELLKAFLKTSASTNTMLHPDKKGSNATLVQGSEHTEFESIKKALGKDLTRVLRSHSTQDDSSVFSVHYSTINGLSQLEHYIMAYEISTYFDEQNTPYRLSSSTLTSPNPLDPRGWALSISSIPRSHLPPQPQPTPTLPSPQLGRTDSITTPAAPCTLTFSSASIRRRLTAGCKAVIAAEPAITHYDTIVGDGDCGITLRAGASKALSFATNHALTPLPHALSALVAELETTMGGTSGALYCIFLSALAHSLGGAESVAAAVAAALEQLLGYTTARRGDRTCLDCLIPFVEVWARGGDVGLAVRAARVGVVRTESMEAVVGRSAYLDRSATRGVPDPGAFGLLMLLEGLCGV
ncbi:Dak phosphatase [Saccharata proteae CBS 121410]|uniref:Dak phosphatase n=1 Tax=Saccharata proteae CBS 121410 TaxID=1314787 RepID=A0A9P4I504_9PEZI|nr:Dak phosphatase [Saccharata proteae CBS 121410]